MILSDSEKLVYLFPLTNDKWHSLHTLVKHTFISYTLSNLYMVIWIGTSLMMIVEQNYTTIFYLLLNQTHANMVNWYIVKYSWDDVWNLSYCTRVFVDPVFLHACVSHLNDATRFLYFEKWFLKSFGVVTYFCFIFKGKTK